MLVVGLVAVGRKVRQSRYHQQQTALGGLDRRQGKVSSNCRLTRLALADAVLLLKSMQ